MRLVDPQGQEIIPFYKGRVALHALLAMADIGPGDEVVLPGYTCVVVPNAIRYCGATPAFVDIDPGTYCMDPKALRESAGASWHPGRAKAIIVQHTYGIPAEMDAIREIAREYDLLIIEDSCHALGSTYDGVPVGSLGDAAFFSAQWSKPFTTGLGGWAVLPPDSPIRHRTDVLEQYPPPSSASDLLLSAQYLAFRLLKRPATFWAIQSAYRFLGQLGFVIGSSSADELDCRLPPDFQRSMGPRQYQRLKKGLAHIGRTIEHRDKIVRYVETSLESTTFPKVPSNPIQRVVYLRYPIRVADKRAALAKAAAARVELGDWFLSPVHPLTEGWSRAGYVRGTCPVAERACEEVINLPTHEQITTSHVDRALSLISEFA